VRPEHIAIVEAGGIAGTVTSCEYHGADTIMTVRVGEETLFVRAPGQLACVAGAPVRLEWKPESRHLFDSQSGARVGEAAAARAASIAIDARQHGA
jgi:ABC-type sugar transport system ATPase subunit